MKTKELEKLFDKYDDEHGYFDRIENKLSNRSDLHAFMLIDKICPAETEDDIICSAEHDEIWIGIEPKQLAKNITEEQILELIRCGIRYDGSSFQMFV